MSKALLLLGALFVPGAAFAATHCVGNATDLRNALDAAESNSEPDEIRIRPGVYYGTSSFPFEAIIAEPHGIAIGGGWTGPSSSCLVTTGDASLTTLDGMNSTTVLRIRLTTQHAVVPITVEGLTLRHGYSPSGFNHYAAGLSISGSSNGAANIVVDRIIVEDNTGTNVAPAVGLSSDDGFIRFSNSIVRWNDTQHIGAINVLANGGGSALLGLTVLANTRVSGTGALTWSGTAPGQLVSSLVWGNTSGADVLGLADVQYAWVRYGSLTGTPMSTSSNHAVEPAPQLDAMHRPVATSPLRDVLPAFVGAGAKDVYGQPRKLGSASDIGAAEGI